MAQTDEAIAAQVQKGNTEAFGLLVLRYEPKLARYARKFLFYGDDVADLVQEVFIKAYTNIRGFDPRRRFSPWVYRIAHNIFLNAVRDGAKNRAIFSIFDADILFPHPMAEESADEGAKRAEITRMLDVSLGMLAPKEREPLVLYYYEDLGYREIAQILAVPVSTVAVRVKRGRERLRKMLAPGVVMKEPRKSA